MIDVDQRSVERLAEHLFQAARLPRGSVPGALALARAYLGRGRVLFVPAVELDGEAQLTEERGRPLVLVRDDVPPVRAPFLVTTCVAEHFLTAAGLAPRDVAAYARRVAAAALAPRDAYTEAVASADGDAGIVASAFQLQQAAGWLRWGETHEEGVAIVNASDVLHQRNALPFLDLPGLARADIRPASVAVARIYDQPGRSAVRAA